MKVEVVNPDEERNSATGAAAADPKSQGADGFEEVDAEVVEPAQDAAAGTDAEAEAPEAGASGDARDAGGSADEAGDPVASDDEVFSLDDLKKARQSAADAQERYVRLEAEWDNYRKRVSRERDAERTRAAESLVTKLLPVVDDIERALDHAATQQPEGAFSQFVDGIEAVHTKFVNILEKEGVEVIDPAGQPFNMHEHQAVGHVDDASSYDETVHDVYQKGYRMGGCVIRPAMVTVTKGGPVRPAEPADADGGAQG
ncbi:MAG: nucleotide exchange factor GrpE [Coriobacteriales bacterium]|jgi:molecular chaperone GrpE